MNGILEFGRVVAKGASSGILLSLGGIMIMECTSILVNEERTKRIANDFLSDDPSYLQLKKAYEKLDRETNAEQQS